MYSMEEEYYDHYGKLRQPGEPYYDHYGRLRKPKRILPNISSNIQNVKPTSYNPINEIGDEIWGVLQVNQKGDPFYDHYGYLRHFGEPFYDHYGKLRMPGEPFYDHYGRLRKP